MANTPKNYIQKFKKSIFIFVSLLILPSLVFSAGIPVVDITANEQMATQNAKEIAEWVKQVQDGLKPYHIIKNKYKLTKMNFYQKQV
ncbi:hypothetical protein [Campylobacter molothri]|uniref:hypothetical protein n=1 Tax=Campylobacter molothri TaxID=1032242 RepID=UPI0038B36197